MSETSTLKKIVNFVKGSWKKLEFRQKDAEKREFYEKCSFCVLQTKSNKCDNVPITPVTHPDEAMHIINIDIIGPIEPASDRYKHVLTAILYSMAGSDVFMKHFC